MAHAGGNSMSRPNPSPEQDITIARDALAKNDLPHAAHHIAWALQTDPENQDALRLLDQIIAAAPDAAALVPLQSTMSSAEAAVHAYIRAGQGDYATALQVISQVNTALPDGRFLPWAADWLARPDARSVEAGQVIRVLTDVARLHRGDTIPDPTVRARVEGLANAVTRYLDAQSQVNPALNLSLALVLRKAGRYQESLTRAQAAYGAEPSAFAMVAIAYAQKVLGQTDAALVSFQKALEHDPNYIEIYNDVGDLQIGLGRTSDGALAYGKVLDTQPDHAWAAPSYYFYQFQLDSDPYWKQKLIAFAGAHPDNQRAAQLIRALSPEGAPYVDYLPAPSEAIINIVKQVIAQSSDVKGGMEVGLSALEAPSAVLSVQRTLGPEASLTIGVADVQRPDPRVASQKVAYTLWKYDGTDATPAVPPPEPAVANALADIATTPFNMPTWKQSARELATKLGDPGLDDLLRTMVHPPSSPPAITQWVWIQNVQVAAALTIAALSKDWERPIPRQGLFGKSSEPAPRQQALHALLFGVMDWTITAAILALTEIALEEKEHEPQIAQWFSDLYFRIPKGGYVAYRNALAVCALRLPSTAKMAVRLKFKEILAEG
jgi:tetratricopeptide (TPR) repeat protein